MDGADVAEHAKHVLERVTAATSSGSSGSTNVRTTAQANGMSNSYCDISCRPAPWETSLRKWSSLITAKDAWRPKAHCAALICEAALTGGLRRGLSARRLSDVAHDIRRPSRYRGLTKHITRPVSANRPKIIPPSALVGLDQSPGKGSPRGASL